MNNKSRWSAEILLAFGALVLGSCSFSFVTNSASSSSQAPASSTGDTASATSEGGAASSSSGSSASSSGAAASSGVSSTSASSAPGDSSSSGSGNFYKVTGDTTTKALNYQSINANQGIDALPTTGSPKILVLPIELTGYEFSSAALNDIDTALNGANGTGYWESVASFYKKSSFGSFTPSYTLGTKYVSSLTPQQLYAKNTSSLPVSSYILRQALANHKKVSGDNCTAYDSDKNGYVDAVIMLVKGRAHAFLVTLIKKDAFLIAQTLSQSDCFSKSHHQEKTIHYRLAQFALEWRTIRLFLGLELGPIKFFFRRSVEAIHIDLQAIVPVGLIEQGQTM